MDYRENAGYIITDSCHVGDSEFVPVSYTHLDVYKRQIKMRQMSEAKTGDERLAKDALVSIMKEEKPNQKEQFKIPKEKISRFFAPGTPTQKIEDTIVKALELYRKRQRSLER